MIAFIFSARTLRAFIHRAMRAMVTVSVWTAKRPGIIEWATDSPAIVQNEDGTFDFDQSDKFELEDRIDLRKAIVESLEDKAHAEAWAKWLEKFAAEIRRDWRDS